MKASRFHQAILALIKQKPLSLCLVTTQRVKDDEWVTLLCQTTEDDDGEFTLIPIAEMLPEDIELDRHYLNPAQTKKQTEH